MSFIGYTADVRAVLHRFLLMLLMLTLPVQGFAAASMLGCASHLPVAVAVVSEMAGCHAAALPDDPPAEHDCAQCDSCAAAAPLLIPGVPPTSLPTANRFVLPPAAWFSGFIPDHPERPPRSILA